MPHPTQGNLIRDLLKSAEHKVSIIAPFIKTDALNSLLEVVHPRIELRCVTRWLPREVAMGVSDLEVMNLLDKRGFTLSLVDKLHAKLYIADDRCLVGSSNVTLSGLSESGDQSNIEILVESTVDDPSVSRTLEVISQAEYQATEQIAARIRLLSRVLSEAESMETEEVWFPASRRPDSAYQMYTNPPADIELTTDTNLILLKDIAASNIRPGLNEDDFREEVRTLLENIPLSKAILGSTLDVTLSASENEVDEYLGDLKATQRRDLSKQDLWLAFVEWMVYYFPDKVIKQPISVIGIRRAQRLEGRDS